MGVEWRPTAKPDEKTSGLVGCELKVFLFFGEEVGDLGSTQLLIKTPEEVFKALLSHELVELGRRWLTLRWASSGNVDVSVHRGSLGSLKAHGVS